MEFPNPDCEGICGTSPPNKYADEIKFARQHFERDCLPSKTCYDKTVHIIGVGFWDVPAVGRTFVPDEKAIKDESLIELHPVIQFSVVSDPKPSP